MSNPNTTTLRAAIADDVLKRLQDRGLPPEKAEAKVQSAKGWWLGAGCFMVIALIFVAAGFYVVATRDITMVLAVVLGMFIVLPFLGALFCANKASGEATSSFLRAVRTLGRAGREVVKGDSSGATDGSES